MPENGGGKQNHVERNLFVVDIITKGLLFLGIMYDNMEMNLYSFWFSIHGTHSANSIHVITNTTLLHE